MTKSNEKKLTLTEMKLQIVAHHGGEHNQYLRTSIAGDACYSSNNSIEYKMSQMNKIKQELLTLRPAEGSEVVDVTLAKKVDIYQRMDDELTELEERFTSDKEVYLIVSGEEWKPYKKTLARDVSQVMNALSDILGEDTNPIQIAK